MSIGERASKGSSAEQVNEWAVQTNKQTEKQVAQYLRPDSCFFWTTVHWDSSAFVDCVTLWPVDHLPGTYDLWPKTYDHLPGSNDAEKDNQEEIHFFLWQPE